MRNKTILCLYPIDTTTDFLMPIYEFLSQFDGFNGYRISTSKQDINDIKFEIEKSSSNNMIIFLGHGASHCVYGSVKEKILTSDDLIKYNNADCIFLSCRSSEFLKSHNGNHIGFGDMPTDYDEVEAERQLNDAQYLEGLDEIDIEYYRNQIVDFFINAIRMSQLKSLEGFYTAIKLFANKEISNLLLNKKRNHYRLLADLIYCWKDEMEYSHT